MGCECSIVPTSSDSNEDLLELLLVFEIRNVQKVDQGLPAYIGWVIAGRSPKALL